MIFSILLFFYSFPFPLAHALEPPMHTSWVIDQVGLLDQREQVFLNNSLENFQKQHGPQLQLLIIPTLDGEAIEAFSIKTVEKWNLGHKKKDNGILLLIAQNEKQIRIEVGKGLEGDIPDALAGRIINQGIKPFFRQGKYRDGIFSGLNLIAVTLGGSLEGIKTSRLQQNQNFISPTFFFFILIFLLFIISILQRLGLIRPGNSYHRRGGYSGGWGSGGSSGGGFGGGFSGGGGGGFSGGGASGNW